MKLDIRSTISDPSFWFILLVGLIAQAVPFVLTLGAPAADSNMVVGFPFTFYSFSGLCGFVSGNAGQCLASFVPLHIFFNLGVFMLLGTALAEYRSRRSV